MVIDSFQIVRLFVAAGHNFVGHHGRAPSAHPMQELSTVRCFAGRGLEGDRFLDCGPDHPGQITFFAEEVFHELTQSLAVAEVSPTALRRNVLTRGTDLNGLIGREFSVQGVRFFGTAECKPCYWMDRAVGPGAEVWLRGRGGLRARVLSDGVLHAEAHT